MGGWRHCQAFSFAYGKTPHFKPTGSARMPDFKPTVRTRVLNRPPPRFKPTGRAFGRAGGQARARGQAGPWVVNIAIMRLWLDVGWGSLTREKHDCIK